MLGRVIADLAPLRESPTYRRLFTGQSLAWLARQLATVAIPYQVFRITHSSLAVGLIGLADLFPLVIASLVGGALADAFDRRKLLVLTHVLMSLTAVALALNARLTHPYLWLLYFLSAVGAGLSGVELPTGNSVVPNLVSRKSFPAAAALNQLMTNAALVLGPSAAGLLMGHVSIASTYWVQLGGYLLALGAVLSLPSLPPAEGRTRPGLRSILDGLAYLKGRRVLVGTFVVDLDAMIFGMPRALFPALGTQVFGGGATTVGLLYAAPGAGALLGALFTGWVGRVNRQGVAVLVAVAVWGASIATFALLHQLWLALLLLGIAGWADVVSAVFRNTILQMSISDAVRGRLSAVHIAVVASGPRLGDVEAGVVARLTSPQISAVSGGLACLAGLGVVAKLLPELAAYRSR